MKSISILAAVLLLAISIGSCTGKRGLVYREPAGPPESFKVYDQDWNVQGHVKKGSFADFYYIYDKDWNVKGYVKWNSFSERYELFDQRWNRKGYLNGGLLPVLKERR